MIVLTLESWLPGTTRAVLSPYARQRQTVITGTIKTQVDQIWNAFWSGGISNSMEVIEQMTCLLFIKRLDELQTDKEKKDNRTKAPVERSEESRVGKECVSTCRSGWWSKHKKQKDMVDTQKYTTNN